MKIISILTCVIGEPENLINTYNSIYQVLSEEVSWTIKFHNSTKIEFIKLFEKEHINIIVEDDSSVYHGMNQGLANVDSVYYLVIGSGDEIDQNGFSLALNFIKNDLQNNTPLYFFSVKYLNSELVLKPYPSQFPIKMACPHPGAILKKQNSMDLNGYDPIYKIASDYDHLSRYVKKFGSGIICDQVLVNILAGGISEQKSIEAYLEEELIRKRVWQSNDWLIYDRMLTKAAKNISHFIGQVIK